MIIGLLYHFVELFIPTVYMGALLCPFSPFLFFLSSADIFPMVLNSVFSAELSTQFRQWTEPAVHNENATCEYLRKARRKLSSMDARYCVDCWCIH